MRPARAGPADEHVLAVGDVQHRRIERVEGGADDELQRAVGQPSAGREVGARRRRSASTPIGGGPPGPPEPRASSGARSTAWASHPLAATTRRPGIGAGARRAGTPTTRALDRVVERHDPPHRTRRQHVARHRAGPLGREDGHDADGRALGDEAGQGVGVGVVERVVEHGPQRRQPIDAEDDDRPSRRGGRPTRVELDAHPAEQTRQALPFVRPHDAGAVIERGQVVQAAGRRGRRSRRRGASLAQAAAQAAMSTDRRVVVVPDPTAPTTRRLPSAGVHVSGSPPLLARIVDQADGTRRDIADVEDVGQRRQPRLMRPLHIAQRGGVADRAHEHGQLGLVGGIVVDGSWRVADRRAAPDRPPAAPGPSCRAAWNTTCSPGPSRSIVRPGTRRGNAAGASCPTTSRASATSCTRSAMRRLVLARMSSLTTPLGRCVARTRWTPRLRPRWATPTRASTKPGSSATSVANSSTTTTSRGRGGRPGDRPPVGEVDGADRSQQSLPSAQLGLEADQGPLGESVVEVGDDADGVRQLGAGVERGAALVVDEHEADVIGAAAGGERGDERAQQLALAGTGGPGDQRVRAVTSEVDLDDAVGGRAEDGDRGRIGTGRTPGRGDGDGVVDRPGAEAGVERAERRRRRAAPTRRHRPRDR